MPKHLNIMGIRGVPEGYGGYESFAARLAPYLAQRDWRVSVYCQRVPGQDSFEDEWNGVRRVHIAPRLRGNLGVMEFDARCVADVLKQPGIDLVLGYDTACFNLIQRIAGRKVAMNMDGLEWQRKKWPLPIKAWYWCNEIVGGNLASLTISDHPEMERHLRRRVLRKGAMIPYGADAVLAAPTAPVEMLGLLPGRYFLIVCRAVPENSLVEVIRAFSRKTRGVKLAVLADFAAGSAYEAACHAAANDHVVFAGAIFDRPIVDALRFHALAYLHGHTVGGTNPSLCEALGAGSAVIAHDNRFNRWVAGPGQLYFRSEQACAEAMESVLADEARRIAASQTARQRHADMFTWGPILAAYEAALTGLLD